jgi:SAM-dependent methyltransferase
LKRKKFDVIITSNLIEHLYNPGLFLENVKRHLKTGGVVLISTPNPFSLMKFIEIVAKDDQGCGVHTMWFDPKTLSNLMAVYGFEIKEIYWTTTSYYVRPWSYFVRIVRAIRGYFCSGFTIEGVEKEKE